MPPWSGGCVVEIEPREDLPQIVNVHLRSETMAATSALSARPGIAGLLVKLHTDLSRPLENVKELPERQVQQSRDHGDRVQDGQKAVCLAAQPLLPFGKFFHIFQRPAQIGVKLYQQTGDAGPGAQCARCGHRFASQMHIDDLRQVLSRLNFDYTTGAPGGHWQALCPACKRKTLATTQIRMKEEARG